MKHLYYYHPLVLQFRSGMTIQETRNFAHLAKRGYKTFFFGTYQSENEYARVRDYTGGAGIELTAVKGTDKLRFPMEAVFAQKIMRDGNKDKIVVTRQMVVARRAMAMRNLMGKPLLVYEMHENAVPHLLERKEEKAETLKREMQRILAGMDGLVLTNYSQEEIVRREFPNLPPFLVLPHAVEYERFHGACTNFDGMNGGTTKQKFVITYTGHFSTWRDIQVLFQSLALLDTRFSLRIAGGISSGIDDRESAAFVERSAEKFGVTGRVTYLGHVAPSELVKSVLDQSSVLVLPLGDNLMAKYFTCPLKLMEYMSTQIPVVAVDFPSVRLLAGAESVYLTSQEPQQFARAIETAVLDDRRDERIANMNAIARRNTFEERSRRLDEWISQLHPKS